MRIQVLTVLILALLSVGCDAYIYRIVSRRCRKGWPRKVVLWSSVALYLMVIVAMLLPRSSGSDTILMAVMWMLFAYMSIYLAKILFVVLDLIAQLPKIWKRKPWLRLTYVAIALGVILLGAMWWGALWGRWRLQTREITVEIPSLPASMQGLRIVQVSDIHLGTYGHNTAYIEHVVEEINALRPDVVFFTGDIVNRRSEEMEPFVETLSQLKAPMGVYAILGNHDYGDYSTWPTPQDKARNLQMLEQMYGRTGWTLLRNETAWLRRGNDSIAVIGVENVGDGPFKTYGDLDKSYPTLGDSIPKILLSHNPAHWVNDICDNKDINIALTLSGHTHAMQIEVLGLSPAVLRYRTWGGLYDDSSREHQLYVNIGIGTVGFPSRIGAAPEITLITLNPKR